METTLTVFCKCGKPVYRGLQCATCYRHSEHFDDKRQDVVERDGGMCQACAETPEHPVVHHREPEVSDTDTMITICQRCHAVIHRTKTQKAWMPPKLLELWAEQHEPEALQMQFQMELPEELLLAHVPEPPLVDFPVSALPEPGPLQMDLLDMRQMALELNHEHTKAISATA